MATYENYHVFLSMDLGKLPDYSDFADDHIDDLVGKVLAYLPGGSTFVKLPDNPTSRVVGDFRDVNNNSIATMYNKG